MVILIILGLVLLNGIFSMSEIAVVSARRTSLSNEAKRGSSSARAALRLMNNPDRFLSTVQVGITLIGILTGMYSGDALAGDFAPILEGWGMNSAYAYTAAKVIIVVLVTYVTIVLGELLPKRIGMYASEKIAKFIAKPMHWLSVIATPFVWILSKSTAALSKLLGIKGKASTVTEEEIKSMIREGTEGGEVQMVEQDIVERVFSLGDRNLESIMTHRSDIIWLDINKSAEQINEIIKEHPFTKYPVADGNMDHVEGIVFLKDMFGKIESPAFSLKECVRPADYLYENMEVYAALENMKQRRLTCALIIDEFGTVNGMVTLKDIMEALVGEMPEPDEEPDIVKRGDGSYLVDGQSSFYNFLDYFDRTDLYPDNEYNTLSGLILARLGSIPKVGNTITWGDFVLEIMDMDGARIDKVLVTYGMPEESS